MNRKRDFTPFISSLAAIVCGLIFGFIILCISNPTEAVAGFGTILTGSITHGAKGIGQVLYYATPLILCGLSVGFAFKTGLFNIGGSGQFLMGAFGGVLVGLTCKQLGPFQWVAALLLATLLGALWGAIPGALKAYFNVNEVMEAKLKSSNIVIKNKKFLSNSNNITKIEKENNKINNEDFENDKKYQTLKNINHNHLLNEQNLKFDNTLSKIEVKKDIINKDGDNNNNNKDNGKIGDLNFYSPINNYNFG